MSIINKEPYIVKVLNSLTAQEIAALKELINGEGAKPIFRSLNPNSTDKLTVADKGVKAVILELETDTAQKLYQGYLIYNDIYCVLITYGSKQSQQLTLIDIHDFKSQIRPCELSIIELRSELDDSEAGEDANIIATVQEALDDGTIIVPGGEGVPTVDLEITLSSDWNMDDITFEQTYTDPDLVAQLQGLLDAEVSAINLTLTNGEEIAFTITAIKTGKMTDYYNFFANTPILSGNTFYNATITYYIVEGSAYLSGSVTVGAYQPEITSDTKLDSDFVTDTNQTNKFVTDTDKQNWNAKQDALPTVINNRYLHTNATTGALEWGEVSFPTNVLKYIGITTSALSDGSTTNPITINNEQVTAVNGDVAFYGSKEFVFNGTSWEELGDEGTATSAIYGNVKLGSDTAQAEAAQTVSSTVGRTYAVQNNASGQMVVNVPWTGVAANPVLAGTEGELTGLEVGSTKYKIDKPIHFIKLTSTTLTEALRSEILSDEYFVIIEYDNRYYYERNKTVSSDTITAKLFETLVVITSSGTNGYDGSYDTSFYFINVINSSLTINPNQSTFYLVRTGSNVNTNNINSKTNSSTNATAGKVLTADGSGGTSWQPTIPTVSIALTQVISQSPIQIQLTDAQYNVFANNKQVIIDITALDSTYPVVVWDYYSEDSSELHFGFNAKSTVNVYNDIIINKSTKVAEYDSGEKIVADSKIEAGSGSSDAGKLLGFNSNGFGYATNNLPILTTAPSSANTEGGIKIVVLSQEPAQKFSGFLYLITSA